MMGFFRKRQAAIEHDAEKLAAFMRHTLSLKTLGQFVDDDYWVPESTYRQICAAAGVAFRWSIVERARLLVGAQLYRDLAAAKQLEQVP